MPPNRESLLDTLAVQQQALAICQPQVGDADQDANGGATNMAAKLLRSIAVASFVRESDAQKFRNLLTKSAELNLSLFERYAEGEPIADSFVTILNYQAILDALAAHRLDTANSLAASLTGRETLDRKHCHIFDRTIGYTILAAFSDSPSASKLSANFIEYCAGRGNKSFAGFATLLDGIVKRDSQKVESGTDGIIKDHGRLSGNGIFKGQADELLCVWGIGLCVLAQHKGLTVDVDHPLIPAVLLASAS